MRSALSRRRASKDFDWVLVDAAQVQTPVESQPEANAERRTDGAPPKPTHRMQLRARHAFADAVEHALESAPCTHEWIGGSVGRTLRP